MTQKQVKTICRAFGFTATYKPEYGEWCLSIGGGNGYYSNDAEDIIFTAMAEYRRLRSRNYISSLDRRIALYQDEMRYQ